MNHLERLIAENQFDTIYHEHFSYFSLYSAEQVCAAHALTAYDVEELPTTVDRCGSIFAMRMNAIGRLRPACWTFARASWRKE